MPQRSDSLPPPPDPVGLRLVVSTETRDRLAEIAWHHGYTMAALMRLVAEELVRDPKGILKAIPKNPRKKE